MELYFTVEHGAGCFSLAQRKVAEQCHDMTTGGRDLSAPQMCSQIGCGGRDLPSAMQGRGTTSSTCAIVFFPKWGDVTNPEDINEDSHDGMDDHTAIAMFVSVWGAPRTCCFNEL